MPNRKLLKKLLTKATALSNLEIGDDQILSVMFVGPRSIAEVNEAYVGHTGITDVISFCYLEDGDVGPDEVAVDLMICVDFAVSEGEERDDSSYSEELALYVVHGLLHAAGEDDLDPVSRKRMRLREHEVMTELRKEFIFSDVFPEAANG